MKLTELEITGLRNLHHVKLSGLANTNIFYGVNGAGKSSVLEALHMLGLARSFRSTQLNPVIEYGGDACTVFGRLSLSDEKSVSMGIRRPRRGGFKIKVGGELKKSVVDLAEILPIQLINATSYLLLEGGPKKRRHFMDWGVFHVEHEFYNAWRRAQRSVKQRNAILRSKGNDHELTPWNQELAEVSAIIDKARRKYVDVFVPRFHAILSELISLSGMSIEYQPGWDENKDFITVLSEDLYRDKVRGFTHHGPHRADLKIMQNGIDADQVLSRGQQKLVVCALRLAQSELLQMNTGKQCILLVDDLPAEIDEQHQERLCHLLDRLGVQLFLTCISPDQITQFRWQKTGTPKLFHVEQGQVLERMTES